jgi:hypothetical protein
MRGLEVRVISPDQEKEREREDTPEVPDHLPSLWEVIRD